MTATATLTDLYGLPLSTGSAAAAEAYRDGQQAMLAQAPAPDEPFRRASTADPEFALPHAALALIEQRELRLPEARASAAAAEQFVARASRREQQHVAAVVDAVSGRGSRAIARIREHLQEFPRDALLLHFVTTSLLFAGQQDQMVQVSHAAGPAYGDDDWFWLGIHAFALQEVRRFEEARRAALRSLALFPLGAFTSHALAHVHYELGEYAEGAGFMPGWLARYPREGGMHLHLSWHLALFYLAGGAYGEVLRLYDEAIRPAAQLAGFQLYDPVSLLWRLQVYGGAAPEGLWPELVEIAAPRAAAPGMIFADLHNGMALAAAGLDAELERLCDSLQQRAARGNPAAEVALPLLQGMQAFARGDYATAADLIEPIEARVYLVGGSKAQREVFHDTLLEALLRSGRFDAAELRLRERLDRRPSPRDFYRVARIEVGRGNVAAAQAALQRTRATWPADEPATELRAVHRLASELHE